MNGNDRGLTWLKVNHDNKQTSIGLINENKLLRDYNDFKII